MTEEVGIPITLRDLPEWMVPCELGKRRVNTPFTPSSDFHHYHLAIKFITIDSTPAISKTLFWILWERYTEEWTLPRKDSFRSRGDRHISHTIEYNCNKNQIIVSAIIEVVQVKCSGTTGSRK